jgi:hypothetical protein
MHYLIPTIRPSILVAGLCVASTLGAVVLPFGVAGAAPAQWSTTPSPGQAGSDNTLNSVSCISTTSCVAVGSYSNGAPSKTLIESWDGSTWSISSSPNVGSGPNRLNGVSCASSASCVAVGTESGQILVESWDGSTWSIVSTPGRGTANGFNGVSCVTATNCVAVGSDNSPGGGTLVESWNGSTWSIVPSLSPGTLLGVSCTGSGGCVAVGWYSSSSTNKVTTLIESGNGGTWSVRSSPNRPTVYNELYGVSCASSGGCIAVGYSGPSTAPGATLVESLSAGGTWSIANSANLGYYSALNGASCTSSTNCVAVGSYSSGTPSKTLIESWNGSIWSIASSANPGPYSALNGVSCATSARCQAVGAYTDDTTGNQATLVEAGHPSPTITSYTPLSGAVGTEVTIKGSNLSGATEVAFNGTPVTTVIVDRGNTIKVLVPTGATTGKIKVFTPLGKAKTATVFTVT